MPVDPKHLRPRWRYLAVELETRLDGGLDRDAFQAAIWSAIRTLLGDVASARIDATVVRFRDAGGHAEAIVRVRRGRVTPARAAIATIDRLDGRPVRPAVCGVSGTIRACEENYLGIDREPPRHDLVTFESVERPATRAGEAVDVELDSTVVGATTLDLT